MAVTEKKLMTTLRCAYKEEAIGKLKAMLNTYWDEPEADQVSEHIHAFITYLEDYLP